MRLSRRTVLKRAGATLAGSLLAGAGLYGYGTRLETEWLKVVKIRIPIRKLPAPLEGFRIVLLSDFHLYPHTTIAFIREVVETSNSLRPDLVVLTGDYVLRRADSIFELAPVLANLNARHGVFSVLGNHDHWKGVEVVRQGLAEHGLPLLENQGLTLVHSGASFYLAGVDDGWSGRPDLPAVLASCPGDLPVVLLAHEPDLADRFCRDERISLQLSGHSHGGQVRLPGLGSPFLPPYGRKYDRGLYRVNQSWLYTNVGVGVTVPIRLNCRPELTEITLVAEPA